MFAFVGRGRNDPTPNDGHKENGLGDPACITELAGTISPTLPRWTLQLGSLPVRSFGRIHPANWSAAKSPASEVLHT